MTEIKLYTRPGEVQLNIIRPDAGICNACDEPLTDARFCWDHRITMFRPGPWKLGEDSFPSTRHTSGKPTCAPFGSSDYAKPQCRQCGEYNSHKVMQYAWHDEITCKTPGCTYQARHSIGD